MNKKMQNVMMAASFILLGLIMFLSSFWMKSLAQSQVDPGFVPRIIAVGLVALGILNTLAEFRKNDPHTDRPAAGQTAQSRKPFLKRHGFTLTLILTFVYIWLIPLAGFLLATLSYLFCQICIFAHDLSIKKLIQYAAIAVAAATGIYLIFASGFGMMLPAGILG